MQEYIDLLRKNEEWLMERILWYAQKYKFTKYTSTLKEAWRLSINGLSDSLISAATHFSEKIPELSPDEKYFNDPISQFGIIEAQKHRQRGITLEMFLGLMKYYRESYIDLIENSIKEEDKSSFYRDFTTRCFDRIEIAFCIEWTSHGNKDFIEELQDTNRKMTNEKNRYLTIFESSYVPMIFLDENLKIANLNQAASDLFTDFKISGSIYYSEHTSNHSLKYLNEQIIQFIKDKKKESGFEAKLNTIKGELLFHIKLKTMLDVSKKFIGSVIMLEDITERKLTEQALLESEERWKFALEGAQDGLWDWNLKTNEVYYSSQWKKMLGFEENEISNKLEEWSKRVHPDDLQDCYKDIQMHLEGKTSFYTNIHRVKCKDGLIKWILDRGKIVKYDDNGKPARMIGTHTDLTERMKIEEKLKEMNFDKDRFISILAHDLRSPFTSILGFLELLINNIDNYSIDQIEKQINFIYSSASNTYNLLEDLLQWAKSKAGKLSFKPKKLVFKDICQVSLNQLFAQASKKGISIQCSVNENIELWADPDMIQTILRNLVSNSIKFTHNNGHINIKAEKDKQNIIISVSDDGIGITKENQLKLWDISQSHKTSGTDNEEGTGLGLLVCKEFVEKHSGKIWVESEPGKGSNFKFTVPLNN